jgi:fatty acid desaturase
MKEATLVTNPVHRLQPWKSMVALTCDWLIIGIALYCLEMFPSIPLFFIVTFVIGNRQHAFSMIAHDGMHRLLFKNKTLNDLITNIFMVWPLGVSLGGFRNFHFQHHRHWHSANDPERFAINRVFGKSFDSPIRPMKLAATLVADLLGLNFITTIKVVNTFESYNKKKSGFVMAIIFQLSFLTAGYLTDHLILPLAWLFASVSSHLMHIRIRLWAEHVGIQETHRTQFPLLINLLFLPHNTSYHWEHHYDMRVPWYNLPQVRKNTISLENPISWHEFRTFHNTNEKKSNHFLREENWNNYQNKFKKSLNET